MFCRILCCFVAKSLFYAIYAVLSRNLFCRYLRALAWRKIEPKILSVEKKGQISGMNTEENVITSEKWKFMISVFCVLWEVFFSMFSKRFDTDLYPVRGTLETIEGTVAV